MTTLPKDLDLTVAQLGLTPQQIILALRHGGQDESGQFEQREVYKAMQGFLVDRELRHIKVGVIVDGTPLVLSVNRVYQYEGNINRLVIAKEERMANLSSGRGAQRAITLSPNEEFILNLTRYLVFHKTGVTVPKLFTTYHVVSPMNEPLEQFRVEFPVWAFDRVEHEIKSRVLALREAMTLADNQLPACSDADKWVVKGMPNNCAWQCPSRSVCFQKRAEFAKLIEQAQSNGYTGNAITPATGSGLVIVEESADATAIV